MTYSIHATLQAERDMDDAANYIAFTLLNPDAAYRLLIFASNVLNSLDHNPERNRPVNDPLLFHGVYVLSWLRIMALLFMAAGLPYSHHSIPNSSAISLLILILGRTASSIFLFQLKSPPFSIE